MELAFDTKKDELLAEPGILFFVEYPELRSNLDVTIHLEGTMTCGVLDEKLLSAADTEALRSDVCSSLAIAVSEAAERIGHPQRIPDHAEELSASVRSRLAKRWAELYGLEPGAIAVTDVSISPEDRAMMEKMEEYRGFSQKTPEELNDALAEMLRSAQEEALNSLPSKTESWTCACGAVNRGNYCTECGKIRLWACECGTLNAGDFCTNCGKSRAQGAAARNNG